MSCQTQDFASSACISLEFGVHYGPAVLEGGSFSDISTTLNVNAPLPVRYTSEREWWYWTSYVSSLKTRKPVLKLGLSHWQEKKVQSLDTTSGPRLQV